jgi:hypothetical protein
MSIRKRNDAQGYERGCRYNREGQDQWEEKQDPDNFLGRPLDPWTQESDHAERSYSPNTNSDHPGDQWSESSSQNLLRQGTDYQFRSGTRYLWNDAVDGNGEVKGGFSGPVRYGVDRADSSGSKNNYSTNSRGRNR